MGKVVSSITIYLIAGFYLLATILAKWLIKPNLDTAFYAIGAIIGWFIIEIIEKAFKDEKPPYHSVLAHVVIILISVFAMTSSNIFLGKGVILFLNLKIILSQWKQYFQTGNINSWFENINIVLTEGRMSAYLYSTSIIFIFLTYLFIRV